MYAEIHRLSLVFISHLSITYFIAPVEQPLISNIFQGIIEEVFDYSMCTMYSFRPFMLSGYM